MASERAKGNGNKSLDEQYVEGFIHLWEKQDGELNAEQKDQLGRAYLKHILGTEEKTIDAFLQDDKKAAHFIGMKQSGVGDRKSDYTAFWKEVAQVTPDAYSEKELSWLIAESLDEGAFMLLLRVDNPKAPFGESPLINKIRVNAHAYK